MLFFVNDILMVYISLVNVYTIIYQTKISDNRQLVVSIFLILNNYMMDVWGI